MKIKIIFSNEQKKFKCGFKLRALITKSVSKALEYMDFKYKCQVSVTFTDNEGIRELNREYREKDAATDVLSFPMYDFNTEELYGEDEVVSLGDIVISVERAKEQAKEIGHTFLEEVAFLAIHSTLHLLGYDHERSPEDDEAQCAAQREIISTLEI